MLVPPLKSTVYIRSYTSKQLLKNSKTKLEDTGDAVIWKNNQELILTEYLYSSMSSHARYWNDWKPCLIINIPGKTNKSTIYIVKIRIIKLVQTG